MGAWGYGPFENDGAADWAYDAILKPAQLEISATLKNKGGRPQTAWYAAAASLVVLDGLGAVDVEVVELALKRLDDLLADRSWLRSWKDPRALQDELRRLRERLILLWNHYK